MHPVHLLRRHLDRIETVEGSVYGVQRVTTVDSRKQNTSGGYEEVPPPVPEPDPSFVQPPQGAGPLFFSGKVGD